MMTPIADMVAKMLTDSVPHDAIVLAIRTAELASQNAGEKSGTYPGQSVTARREYERARKAKWRANKQVSNTSAKANDVADVEVIVPGHVPDTAEKRCNFLSSLSLKNGLSKKKDKREYVDG